MRRVVAAGAARRLGFHDRRSTSSFTRRRVGTRLRARARACTPSIERSRGRKGTAESSYVARLGSSGRGWRRCPWRFVSCWSRCAARRADGLDRRGGGTSEPRRVRRLRVGAAVGLWSSNETRVRSSHPLLAAQVEGGARPCRGGRCIVASQRWSSDQRSGRGTSRSALDAPVGQGRRRAGDRLRVRGIAWRDGRGGGVGGLSVSLTPRMLVTAMSAAGGSLLAADDHYASGETISDRVRSSSAALERASDLVLPSGGGVVASRRTVRFGDRGGEAIPRAGVSSRAEPIPG